MIRERVRTSVDEPSAGASSLSSAAAIVVSGDDQTSLRNSGERLLFNCPRVCVCVFAFGVRAAIIMCDGVCVLLRVRLCVGVLNVRITCILFYISK